jgi:hypothetical protein
MIIRNDNIVEATINDLPDYELLYNNAFGLTTANLKAWFKGDAGVALIGTSSDVSSWTSQFGTPTIVANAGVGETDWEVGTNLNGYPSLRQPVAAFKTLSFSSTPAISYGYTIFAVLVTPEAEPLAEYILKSGESGMCGFNLREDLGGTGAFLFDGSSLIAGSGVNTASPQYIMWQSGPQGTNLRQNGTQYLTNGTAKNVSPDGIFSRSNAQVWEILIYADVKSNTDIVNIENYLKTKYGF